MFARCRYEHTNSDGEAEPFNEYGVAQRFLAGSFFKGFHADEIVHVAWFNTVYPCDMRPGGMLVKGPKMRPRDQHVSIHDLIDVACTINPKRHAVDPDNKDYFLMEFHTN